MRSPFRHHGAHEPGRGRKAHHAPTAGVAGLVADSQQPRSLARNERDVESIERIPEALTLCLDKGLLARPTVEEALRPLCRLQRPISRLLGVGEEPPGELI